MSETTTTAPAAPSTAPAATAAPAAPAAPAPGPTQAPTTVTQVPPTPQPAPGATAAPPAPAAPAGEPQDVASLPQWAQEHIRGLRTEAADWRTRAQGTAPQGADPAAPPAPPTAPGAEPTAPGAEGDLTRLPRWAQQAVTDGQGAAKTLAVQSAVIAAAPAAGADIARLLDSSSAMRALAAVDPADQAAVTAAIQAAVTAQPHLAAGGFNPGRGGAEFSAPNGEVTPAQFAAMDYSARAELYRTDPDTYRRLAG